MANLSWQYYKGYYDGFTYWDDIDNKNDDVKKRIKTFFDGQNKKLLDFTLVDNNSSTCQFKLKTAYPGLLIGSGYTHETGALGEAKLGLQLDYTTGLPVIPGSSVKGKLRSFFPHFNKNRKLGKGELFLHLPNHNKRDEISIAKAEYIGQLLILKETGESLLTLIHQLELTIFEGVNVKESGAIEKPIIYPLSKRDIFYDAFPVKGGKDNKLFETDSITPHGENPLKNPTPITFLKVKPKVEFAFNFDFKSPIFENIDSEKKKNLFEKLLQLHGIGAKTNVGYGQFE